MSDNNHKLPHVLRDRSHVAQCQKKSSSPSIRPDGQVWAELGYMPLPLRTWSLSVYILLCLLMITGLLFSNIYALRNNGLYDYDGNATPRYFVAQYLPQLLGMVLILWLFIIEAAIYRILPYMSMSRPGARHTILQDYRIIPANFLLPDLSWFSKHEPALGVCFLMFWVMNISIPLLSCSLPDSVDYRRRSSSLEVDDRAGRWLDHICVVCPPHSCDNVLPLPLPTTKLGLDVGPDITGRPDCPISAMQHLPGL